MTGFIRGVAKIGGSVLSHGDEAKDVASIAGAGDDVVEAGSRSLAGRAAAGAAKGAGKVGKAAVDHPITAAKVGILGYAAHEFGPLLMAAGKKVDGVMDAMKGPLLDENGNLSGLGTAGLGVATLGAGAWAINKIKGDDHEQRPQIEAIGGGQMPAAYDAAAAEQYKKEHDFIPFNQ